VKQDSHKKSVLKSIVWRILGVLVLGLITYVFTRSWIQTTAITFIHHATFLLVYYLHERMWVWIAARKHRFQHLYSKRSVYRPLIYEIFLGHVILGLITFLVTGSWLAVSIITPVYILNKLWIYVVYDRIWGVYRT